MTLADVLVPMSVGQFTLRHFQSAPLRIAGGDARFTTMLPGFDRQADAVDRRVLLLLMRDIERILGAVVTSMTITYEAEPLTLGQDYLLFQGAEPAALYLWRPEQDEADDPHSVIALGPGDAVYIPRGWSLSSAAPMTWPALGIRNPNGRDLLRWLSERLENHEFLDRDLPRFADPGKQADYLTELRRTIAGACRIPGLLTLYTRSNDNHAPARVSLVPDVDTHLSDESMIDFLAARRLHPWRPSHDAFGIKFVGKDLHFPIDAADLIAFLENRAPLRMGDFQAAFAEDFSVDDLSAFIVDLARQGLVAIMPPENG